MTDITMDCSFSKSVPCTNCQKELWLASQTSLNEYDETAIRASFTIKRSVSPELLRETLRRVLRQTPLLGAVLSLPNGEPLFTPGNPDDVDLRVVDLRNTENPHQAMWSFLDGFYEEPVNVRVSRFALVRIDETESLYAFKCSHLVMDGLGSFLHAALVSEIYGALAHGKEPELGAPLTCDELFRQDMAHRESARFAKDMAFWTQHLEKMPEKRVFRALPGCTDILGNSRCQKFYLSEKTSRQVEQILKSLSISPAIYFTALHALIVSFMCDEPQVAIQTPVAFGERKSPAHRQGAQISLPPVLADVGNAATFEELVKSIEAQCAKFFRHIRTPYQLALRTLSRKNLTNLADLFVNFIPFPFPGTPEFPLSNPCQYHSDLEPVLFGLMVLQEADMNRFSLNMRSSRNHLSEQDVERYVRRVALLSEQLASGRDISELTYLLEEEEQELRHWQRGETKEYSVETMPGLFDQQAEKFAERLAVQDEHGAGLTYAQVRENSLRCATWLTERGVRKGDIVAVAARRTVNLPEVVLGVQRCGAVYLPVDPNAPSERLDFILADAHPVLTMDLDDMAYRNTPHTKPPVPPTVHDAAYLIYTSGSTGRPKGVLAPHGGFVNMIQGQIEYFGITEQDRVLLFAPPIFDAALSELFMGLHAGACVYPVSDTLRNEPWNLRQHMADNAVSVTTFPPSYLHVFDREPFPGLRVLITAGEPPVADDALHYAAALQYFNAYGPTETCVCATIKRVTPGEALPISTGRPIPNVSAVIRNTARQPLPAGIAGELWIGGASVALEYHGNPQLTAQRFHSLPEELGERSYATGDLALWSPQGEIILMGRADDQVKIRGNRVELGEVAFLLERCPSVRQACALLIEHGPAKQAMLAAALVLHNDAVLEQIVSWCRENLPAYMIPSFWHVVEGMPVSPTGKIDRTALKTLIVASEASATRSQPLDPRLLALFERVIGHPYDPAINFFDQGGNSLTAMTLLRDIRNTYSVDLAFRTFMGCDTLYDLAALLQSPHAPRTETQNASTAPLGRNQFHIWAYQQANPRSIDYNMPLLLEIHGAQGNAFITAVQDAVNAQELFLCTVGGAVDTPHFQHTASAISVDRTALPDAVAADAYFDRLIHTPFDLQTEPPIRLTAVDLPKSVRLLILVHHIAGDGETLDILLRNALRCMNGNHDTQPDAGALSTQTAFCDRERAYERSRAFAEDAAYWQQELATPTSGNFPAKRIGAMNSAPLPLDLAARLEAQARHSGISVLARFVTAYSQTLCAAFGVPEVVIGVPMGLRETRKEFQTAGFYVNTVPLRLQHGTGSDAAGETATRLTQAIAHSRYCVTEAVPTFLATHSHTAPLEFPNAPIDAPLSVPPNVTDPVNNRALRITRLQPQLRASKFSASATLETGEIPGIILEYDAGLFTDSAAFLQQLIRTLDTLCEKPVCETAAHPTAIQVLTEAWRTMLRAAPDEHSDFFRSGGDSIKAIQITGALHRHGFTSLTASDFLSTPHFRDLCALLATTDASDCPPASGISIEPVRPGHTVPLLPIQQALIHKHPDHWRHFHMMLPMALGPLIPQQTIEAWLRGLPEKFEALRLSFAATGALLSEKPHPPVLTICHVDTATDREPLLRHMAQTIIAGLNPETGRTLGAALAEYNGERLFVLAGHHLVLDVVSLDILQRDLRQFCLDGSGVKESCGMGTRSVAMHSLVEQGKFPTSEDHAMWNAVCRTPATPLAAVRTGHADIASQRVCTGTQLRGFRPDHTATLLPDLLSALACALRTQGQQSPVFLTLESHGRDAVIPDFESSQSVGWFTAVCPMPLVPAAVCSEARRTIHPWLAQHFSPAHCNAYGYLAAHDPQTFDYSAQISFNYLGILNNQPDSPNNDGKHVTPLFSSAAPGNIPDLLHPDFAPSAPLELSLFFDAAETLHLNAFHSPHVLLPTWVSGLLEAWKTALTTLPAYQSPLSENQWTRICEYCDCRREAIESIRPPAATLEPLLYQALQADKRIYTQQIQFHFTGDVNDAQLMRAWNSVVSRHESLRSLFPMPQTGEFYHVVMRTGRCSTEYHDFSPLPRSTAQTETEAQLLMRRTMEFNLNTGPLLRAQFFRYGEREFMISWSFHHLLMDGWCAGILLRELFATYATLTGRPAQPLPAPVPLARYTQWRARFDEQAARNYWTTLLKGFTPLTGVTGPAPATSDTQDPHAVEWALDETLSGALAAMATEHAVTLPILVQSLWAFVLSAGNNTCRDVVYGVVVSGRPAELEDMDRAVGMFIQTLPLRVRWSPQSSLADLLTDVKAQSLQQMRYGYLPLAAMGKDLLDHLMVFENYPFKTLFEDGTLELREVRGFEKIPYPLGISVVPSKRLLFRFLFDPARMDESRVRNLCDQLHTLLRVVATQPGVSCAALEAQLAQLAQPGVPDLRNGHAGTHSATDHSFPPAEGAATTVPAVEEPLSSGSADTENNRGTGSPVFEDAGVGITGAANLSGEVATPGARDGLTDGDMEAVVADIYATVLQRDIPSPDADFFLLGGHSLLVMQVMAQVSKRLGIRLAIEDIFDHASVRQLAAFLRTVQAPALHIPRCPAQDTHPLSASQRRIWFLQRLHEDNRIYQIPFAARAGGPVDPDVLQQALALLERRHEGLRLRVFADTPEQTLAPLGSLRLEYHDGPYALNAVQAPPCGAVSPQSQAPCGNEPDSFSGTSNASRPDRTARTGTGRCASRAGGADGGSRTDENDADMPLGVDSPLVRVALYRESATESVLTFRFHHIIFDGWSSEIFLRELNQAYSAVLHDTVPEWKPTTLDYLSYIHWEAEQKTDKLDTLKTMLLPLPERLRLPLDFPRPAVQSYAGDVVVFSLRPDQIGALKHHAHDAGVSLFPVLIALINAFLFRHTGQTDLLVGCPAANREEEQTQDLLGLFVNTLAIRTTLAPDSDFRRAVASAHTSLNIALSAQHIPFEQVVDAVCVERNPSRNPLFDVFVALENDTWTNFAQEPLCLQAIPLPHNRSKFDLSVYFKETGPDSMEVHIEYCTALFRKETVHAMGERLSVLLDDALLRPDTALADLTILPDRERAMLESFNNTKEPLDAEQNSDTLFRAQAARNGAAPAIVEASGHTCDYAGFSAMVDAMATHLTEAGLAPGSYAGVCFNRSLVMMVTLFAVERIGAVYVPLSANLPNERLSSMLEDLGSCIIVTDTAHADTFARCGHPVLTPDISFLSQRRNASIPGAPGCPSPSAIPAAASLPAATVSPDAVAYVIFTSGSTGRPKGVPIRHRSLCNRLLWMQSQFPIGPGDVVLQKTTVTFDVSVWELFWWSWCGASLALLEPEAEKNPGHIVQTIAAQNVTVLHFVPSMLRVFLEYLEFQPDNVRNLKTLRYVFTSGEALSSDLVARFHAVFHGQSHAELHNLYGPTEATIDVTWQPCPPESPQPLPIGRPIANTHIHVLDARQHRVPVGSVGELYISGVQVAPGYLNRPELTARNFLPDPFIPGNRMYRTGDLGRWLPNGAIEYLGRNDDQVKIRGFRLELGEVEAALGRCTGVSQAVVRVCRIGGYDALEAFLLPRSGARPALRSLRSELAAILPDYMHPARWFVVDAIPLSPSGKADRKAISGSPLATGSVSEEYPAQEQKTSCGVAHTIPKATNGLENAVRGIWQTVMPEAGIGDADTGFFEAGGNSLLLVQLHNRLEEQWKGVFTLASLFSESTIRQQAARIELAQAAMLRPRAGSASHPRSASLGTHGVTSTPLTKGASVSPEELTAPIAIIGMAVRFGEYEDAERFWDDLAHGVDKNVDMPEKRRQEVRQIFEAVGYAFDPAKLRQAAYLSDISSFDYKRFGLSPNDARLLDPKQRIFLETALHALDDAGYGGQALEGANVGTFVGASPYRMFQDAVTRCFPDQSEQIYLLNVPSNVVARISYLKNWHGPAASVDTACSSVLTALHDACHSLRIGESHAALVGGVHTIDLPVKGDTRFAIEAASGQTRTFDAKADGVGAGEGAAVFVLKRLEDALRDNDAIHAVIAGSAVNQDGRSSSMAAPNPEAQADVIAQAARQASVPLADICFFEAHGTATVLGDPVEVEGLTKAFAREGITASRKALIGSVKGNIGHLDAAAGAAGLAKAVVSLKKGHMPPQPHFQTPNPHINFSAAPVRVPRALEPLPEENRPWTCGVSSFGLSGVNAHVILREHIPAPLPADTGDWYCIPLSAATEAGLKSYCRRILEAVERNPHWTLHAIAATLVAGREYFETRLAVIAHTRQELLDQLRASLPESTPQTQPESACLCHNTGDNKNVPGSHINNDTGGTATDPINAVLPSQADAEAAATAFLHGARLLWPRNRPLHRVHLPATPWNRTRLWPGFTPRVVSSPVETPSGTTFALALGHPDFWPVAEHRLLGVPTMVGMALPDIIGMTMLASAPTSAPISAPISALSLKNMRWHAPLTYEPGSRATLSLQRHPDSTMTAELHHCRNDEWQLAASATVCVPASAQSAQHSEQGSSHGNGASTPSERNNSQPQQTATLDIAALRDIMRPHATPVPDAAGTGIPDDAGTTPAQPSLAGTASPVRVSARWQCREALWISEEGDQLLARITLPESYRHDLRSFRWHPAMLDIASSLALYNAPGFVPARCDQMRLDKPLPATIYAYVVITENQPELRTARCTITDQSGQVLAELSGLVFLALHAVRPASRQIQNPARSCVLEEPQLFALRWIPATFMQQEQRGVYPSQTEHRAKPGRTLFALQDPTATDSSYDTPEHSAGQPNARGGVLLVGTPGDSVYDAFAPMVTFQSVLPWSSSSSTAETPPEAVPGTQLPANLPMPTSPEETNLLIRTLCHNDIAHLIYLPPLPEPPSQATSSVSGAWAFASLLRDICRAGLRAPLHVTVVGRGALTHHETSPDHALHMGLLLALRQEEPLLSCSYTELDSAHPAALEVLRQHSGDVNGICRIDDAGILHVPQLETLNIYPSDSGTEQQTAQQSSRHSILPDGCVIITGGLGGMGLRLARDISVRTGAKVVLLYRSGTAPADLPFATYQCDVTDVERLGAVLADVRRTIGPIQGVIHAAGVAGRGFLLSKEQTSYEAVLAPKVLGTWNLHTATRSDTLRFFVLASSRTSLTGAPGQTDYTAANAFLNAFAHYRRAMGLPALSLCWNTWSEVGMAVQSGTTGRNKAPARQKDGSGFFDETGAPHATDRAARHTYGVANTRPPHVSQTTGDSASGADGTSSPGHTLAPSQAFGVLENALASGETVVVVAMAGENASRFPLTTFLSSAPAGSGTTATDPARSDEMDETGNTGKTDTPATGKAGETNASADCLAACGNIREADLLEIFRDCLGYDTPLSRDDDFFDLGGDSIAGTRVVSRIAKTLGVSVSLIDLLESDTLGDFIDHVRAACTPETPTKQGITPAPVRETYPVGQEQLSILYADLLNEGQTAYNLPAFLVMPPQLDKNRLEAAIGALIERHDVLRTTFCDFDTEHPGMVIHPFTGFTLEEVAIPDLTGKDRFIAPFDLKREPGFRIHLLNAGDGEYVLFFDIHHALADGRTISLFNAELFRLYHGKPLEPVLLQQKDFAWHQFAHPNAEDKAYWQTRYAGNLPKLDLPADFPRPPLHTRRGGMYEFALEASLVADMKTLARRQGVTNYHIVLAAWSLLAHVLTGNTDIVIAISVDSRNEYLNTAGMLASMLPLRLDVRADTPVGQMLKNTQQVSNEALRHQSYILNTLLTDRALPATPERSPLSEIMLSYMNYEFANEEDALFETLRFDKAASKTDVSIFCSDSGGVISFALEYYADLFSHATIVRMATDVTRILEAMVSGNAEAPVPFIYSAPPAGHGQGGPNGSGESSESGEPGKQDEPDEQSGHAPTTPNREQLPLSPTLAKALHASAKTNHVSAPAVLLATLAVLLSRVTAQERVSIVHKGRSIPFTMDDDTEFNLLLTYAQSQLTLPDGAPDHDSPHGSGREAFPMPGTELSGCQRCDTRSSATPDSGQPPTDGHSTGGHGVSSLRAGFVYKTDAPVHTDHAEGCDLVCTVHDSPDGMTVQFSYTTHTLTADTAHNWLHYYEQFLDGITQENV